jgi:hypothetical protein
MDEVRKEQEINPAMMDDSALRASDRHNRCSGRVSTCGAASGDTGRAHPWIKKFLNDSVQFGSKIGETLG